jgi:hypothetical protein
VRYLKKNDKIILLLLFLISIIRIIFGYPLDNYNLLGGVDTSTHLTFAWHFFSYGLAKWDFLWYGGYPFMRYYPPLFHLMAGMLGRLIGFLLAFKLTINIIMLLTSVIFYFFLREFKLSEKKIIVALLFFSFMPLYAHYNADGRFPTLFNLFFILCYWIFLKRAIDRDDKLYLFLSSLLLSINLLIHHTTTFIFLTISFFWSLTYKLSMKTFFKFLTLVIIGLLITSFWTVPFFSETFTLTKESNFRKILETPSPSKLMDFITFTIGNEHYYTWEFGPTLVFVVMIMSITICLFSLLTLKNKNTRDFLITIILMFIILFIVRYKRVLAFLPIPISILIAEGFFVLKNNLRKIIIPLFFVLLIFSYLSIKPKIYQQPEYPNIPKDGRVLFLPFGYEFNESENEIKWQYSIFLSEVNGNEDILGWYQEAEHVGETAGQKIQYDNMIQDPLHIQPKDYYSLAKAGWVNYICVNKNSEDIVRYFNENKYFKLFNKTKLFYVFQMNPKTSYVELNGQEIDANITKLDDEILVDFECKPGELIIKESFHKSWKPFINGKEVSMNYTDHGFIVLQNNEKGHCSLQLNFEDPSYYSVFNFLSPITLIIVLLIICYEIFSSKFKYHSRNYFKVLSFKIISVHILPCVKQM